MTGDQRWSFPLLALAISPAGNALAVFMRPLRMGMRQSWRKASSRYVGRVLSSIDFKTVLVTHATRRDVLPVLQGELRKLIGLSGVVPESLTLDEACKVLECESELSAIAARVVDAYPELEEHLRGFTAGKLRTKRARMRRPLLSSLAIAHAASVAHVTRHG